MTVEAIGVGGKVNDVLGRVFSNATAIDVQKFLFGAPLPNSKAGSEVAGMAAVRHGSKEGAKQTEKTTLYTREMISEKVEEYSGLPVLALKPEAANAMKATALEFIELSKRGLYFTKKFGPLIALAIMLSSCDWNGDGVDNKLDKINFDQDMQEAGDKVNEFGDNLHETLVDPVEREVKNSFRDFDNAVSTAIPSHGAENPVEKAINAPGLEDALRQLQPTPHP